VRYPGITNAFDLLGAGAGIARWCPGNYTGQVVYNTGGPLPPSVDSTFGFRVSSKKRTPQVKPAVARNLTPVAISPERGLHSTIFAVRYRADRAAGNSGDVVEVDGPTKTACRGVLVRGADETQSGARGSVTLHIGPSADAVHDYRWKSDGTAYEPARDSGFGAPLRDWCAGTYRGTIFYENVMKFDVIARFTLTVAR
jgi:hypothetical protein